VAEIKSRKIKWEGHVGMESTRVPQKILDADLRGKEALTGRD
jgi:hypothetical protein